MLCLVFDIRHVWQDPFRSNGHVWFLCIVGLHAAVEGVVSAVWQGPFWDNHWHRAPPRYDNVAAKKRTKINKTLKQRNIIRKQKKTSIVSLFPSHALSFHQPLLRWATTWVPSFQKHWFSGSACEACGPGYSWTDSSRCAHNCRAWPRPSGRKTQTWRATSASATRNSSAVPSPGSCES